MEDPTADACSSGSGEPNREGKGRHERRREAFRGANHCIRMQREISFAGMVFGVFPLLSKGTVYPFCEMMCEVTDLLDQLLAVRLWL